MRTDLQRSLRRLKPSKFITRLTRRPDNALKFVTPEDATGPSVLLDTTVYVDALNEHLPAAVEDLIKTRTLYHVSVVIAELTNWFGSLSPNSAKYEEVLLELAGAIEDIPQYRIEAVTEGVMLEAGIMSGLVYRLGGFQPAQHLHAINDAAIYLHALERGHAVLTRNIRDFDFMQQILPAGRVLFYRKN